MAIKKYIRALPDCVVDFVHAAKTATIKETYLLAAEINDKRGEKTKGKKGKEDGLYMPPDRMSKLVVEIPRPDGSKKVDETQNAFAALKANMKGSKRFEEENKVLMEKEEQGTSKPKRRQPTRKAQQAEDISKRDTEGKSDKEIQRNYQYLLTKVRTLEQFSKVLYQKLSEKDDESMRNDYLEYIMAYKKYRAEKYQYKEWTISELQEETARIQKMIQDKVTRWREEKVLATYKNLEELRKRDSTAPKKPNFPEAVVPVKQQKLPIRGPTAPHASILYQRRKEKQIDELTKEDKAQEEYIIKMVLQAFIEEKQDSAQSKL
ncbi:uncharacterized protein LOC110943030 [Helianthus annuus]|uniref:uncharacterized protein LOC110943030 n=1 Tax=Helianthus annuus TaxID=4232 RepID=UPI000B8F31AD|nr:uncharacterized protein LOC110943030 [Helianthus annuus]